MITKIIHEEKIQKAKKYVEKGESFVIVTHVTPDNRVNLRFIGVIGKRTCIRHHSGINTYRRLFTH